MSRPLIDRWCLVLATVLWSASAAPADETSAALDYFEREVRPVLATSCWKCHGPEKQESDLRLDSRAALLQGGASGPAIVPGQPDQSLLMAAIRHTGDLEMPPQSRLPEPQIRSLAHWISIGAPWPEERLDHSVAKPSHARDHWAFQPLRDPPVPIVEGECLANPIDAFVRARLREAGLGPSPPADFRTLARRVSFGLTGLPPTPEAVAQLVSDPSPQAYEAYVEQLLAQPQYGEHWGRHWLDVARYSDTKGYVYAREQRTWVHAWVYRDWVVKALNDDLPYDRFLLLQIAADQAAPDDRDALAAMGFLTLGRRFLGVSREIIDDRIDVVTRGAMGLTVACARCHDHKYDPIPTSDYYSLYGIFQSCSEQMVALDELAGTSEAELKFAEELSKRQTKLAETLAARRKETADRNRTRVGDYLAAQFELHQYPPEGFDQILAKTDLLPTFVHLWRDYLAEARHRRDPIFEPWHAYCEIPVGEFAERAAAVTQGLADRPHGEINSRILAKFSSPPASLSDVVARYAEAFAEVDRRWQSALSSATEKQRPPPTELAEAADEALRQVLYGRHGPCEVPDEPIVNIEYYFDSGTCNELWKLQGEVDNWILQSPLAVRHAVVLRDREVASTPWIFKRGNPANRGAQVPRQFVSVLAGPKQRPFTQGSGRLELARAIIDPQNPLTARVIVNRVWAHHFGTGLVRTTSDFGTRSDPPSHPDLLDWLTTRFIRDGWSLKKLHRRILLSETYRQSGSGPSDQRLLARAIQLDPENRLLWRMAPHRLSFEEMRDAFLAAAGQLDRAVGGRAGDLFSHQFNRRTLYGMIDRQFLPGALRVFDFANPDLHTPQRSETTTPQQALFLLNHPLAVHFARALAARTADVTEEEARVQQLYQLVYQRSATPDQVRAALEIVQAAGEESKTRHVPDTAAAWQYGYGRYDEPTQRVAGFEKLPHFTGDAWQGGPIYPDPALGWLQLTATGGHPGNDLAHAVIRRWTAPRAMRIQVKSTLKHEPRQGKGARAFLVNSRTGLLRQAAVHHSQEKLEVDEVRMEPGDTLDFVVDIGSQLSHNQFLWRAVITELDEPRVVYDSEQDFMDTHVTPLNGWEQLAQVLIAANEFVFVD